MGVNPNLVSQVHPYSRLVGVSDGYKETEEREIKNFLSGLCLFMLPTGLDDLYLPTYGGFGKIPPTPRRSRSPDFFEDGLNPQSRAVPDSSSSSPTTHLPRRPGTCDTARRGGAFVLGGCRVGWAFWSESPRKTLVDRHLSYPTKAVPDDCRPGLLPV